MGVVRTIMVILNSILFLFGMILAVIGAFIIYKINEIGLHNPMITIFYSLFGVLICGVTGFGIFIREARNRKLLFIYAVALLVVAVAQVPVCSTTFDIGTTLHKDWKDDLEESFGQYYKDALNRNRFNYIQTKYSCCGFTSKDDYEGRHLPRSCCVPHYNQTFKCNRPTGYYKEGCSIAIWKYFNHLMFRTLFATLCFCILEIVTAGLAFYQFLKPPKTEEEKAQKIAKEEQKEKEEDNERQRRREKRKRDRNKT